MALARRTNKTEAVLKLIQSNPVSNPILNEDFKNEMVAPVAAPKKPEPEKVEAKPENKVNVHDVSYNQRGMEYAENRDKIMQSAEAVNKVIDHTENDPRKTIANPNNIDRSNYPVRRTHTVDQHYEIPSATPKYNTKVNITSELISAWMPQALQRFGCCQCDRCLAETSVESFKRLEPITVIVRTEADLKEAERLREANKQSALMTMIKIAIERKGLPHHE